MMKHTTGVLLRAMLAVAAASGASAQTTLTQNTVGGYLPPSGINGQSFTIGAAGTYTNVDFSFQSDAGANVGAGNLYLFDRAYAGTPGALASASYLGAAAFSGGGYTFGSLLLAGQTKYYAYLDTELSAAGNSAANPYAGGERYYAADGSDMFSTAEIPGRDLRFTVSGTAAATSLLAQNNVGGYLPPSGINGQSFTIGAAGAFNDIVFNFQSDEGANVGAGKLYLFSTLYTGTPDGLPGAAFLGQASYGANGYSFGSLVLNGQAEYYAYLDTELPAAGNSASNPYAGGERYYAMSGSDAFGTAAIPGRDLRFTVTGNAITPAAAVPEPAAWMVMIAGFGVAGAAVRRRRPAPAGA